MSNFKVCDTCFKKVTTVGCLDCKVNKIKSAANELDEFLIANKSNLSQYVLFINTLYYTTLKSVLNFNLDTILDKIKLINLMGTNEVCIIVDIKKLDWGNINTTVFREDE